MTAGAFLTALESAVVAIVSDKVSEAEFERRESGRKGSE